MTKIDIISGFLGAGKTTFIKKMIAEAYQGEKIVLIENEFGEIGIDGGFLQDAGLNITEMNSGCICCSLVGDFGKALEEVLQTYHPDRILIEPSGVGKLSDVIRAVEKVVCDEVVLNSFTTIVDAKKCKMYMKNFGEFFGDQVQYANAIVLSHTDGLDHAKKDACLQLIREHNKDAAIVATPWSQLTGEQLLATIEKKNTLETMSDDLIADAHVCKECGHIHHHDEHCEHDHEHHHHHDEHCDCGHEHHHHDEHCEHEHEHEHEHHHHHNHDEHCDCGHDHHHHHHADEVFTSFGTETANVYSADELRQMVAALEDANAYGMVLRAKGIVEGDTGEWLHFDYVPGETDVRVGCADVIGKICVIGSDLHTESIQKLFRIGE